MFIPQVSISTRKVVFYDYWDGVRRSNHSKFTPFLRQKVNRISAKTYKRMRDAIQTLIDTAPYKTVFVRSTQSYFRYKVNFITLTLPSKQIHTDKEIQLQCLRPFLEAWQKRRPALLYVWKAEVQENGNVHYHIVSNSFYHYKKLRKDWNKYVEKLGYCSRSSSDNPNSTDVHALDPSKNIAQYLTNYFCKKDLYSKSLKRWHNRFNTRLKALDSPVFILPRNYLSRLKRSINGTSFSCSKVLQKCKISLYRNDSTISDDMNKLELIKSEALQTDHALCYFFKESIQHRFPLVYKALKFHLSTLLKMQHDNILDEAIDAL